MCRSAPHVRQTCIGDGGEGKGGGGVSDWKGGGSVRGAVCVCVKWGQGRRGV